MTPFNNSPEQDTMALEERPQLKPRTRLFLNVGSVFFAAALLLPLWGGRLDHAISDAFFLVRGPLSEPPDIVIVGIDDEAFQYLDLQWPWPRRLHAKLLESLFAARARVVVFDVLFDTHSTDPQDDRLFYKAMAAHPNVVLATARAITDKKTFSKESWLNPVNSLSPPNTPIGCIELPVDADGVVRRALTDFAGTPSLAYLAARSFAGEDHWQASADRAQVFVINFIGPPRRFIQFHITKPLKPESFYRKIRSRINLFLSARLQI